MPVKVIAIDDQDRVKLSRKAALKELASSTTRSWPAAASVRRAIVNATAADRGGDRGATVTAAAAAMAADGIGTNRDPNPNDEFGHGMRRSENSYAHCRGFNLRLRYAHSSFGSNSSYVS